MHCQFELDPTHSVILLTVLEESISLECAEDCYLRFSQIASNGVGPYAAIYDLSMAKRTTIPTDMIRDFARRTHPLKEFPTIADPGEEKIPIPTERKHVLVGEAPSIYGLSRLFQICAENVGKEFEVVHTLEEAYKIVGVHAEDFIECLI